MMLPGARYWNTRLDVVKNCLEARLGQNSRHTYMSVVGSHVTCSIVTTRRSQSLLFGTGWLYIITHTIKFMRPEQRPLLRPWSLQGLKLCFLTQSVQLTLSSVQLTLLESVMWSSKMSWNRGKNEQICTVKFQKFPDPTPSALRASLGAPPSSISVCSWHFQIF